ncbi:MAG: Hsp20/alpha crystallin family protein [Candidatus Hydrogenedentota bacterium]
MTTATAEKSTRYIMPRVNVIEEPDKVRIEAELAGVSKDNIELEVKEGELTLVGHRDHPEGDGRFLLRERAPADYRRVFVVSNAVDTERVNAVMKDGVLNVTLPKTEAFKPRTIEIK